MKRFDYLIPKNLPEALAMMSDRPEAIPLAGGTDILLQMKEGQRSVEALLSLKRIPELHHRAHNGTLTLGGGGHAWADLRRSTDSAGICRPVDRHRPGWFISDP